MTAGEGKNLQTRKGKFVFDPIRDAGSDPKKQGSLAGVIVRRKNVGKIMILYHIYVSVLELWFECK